MRRVLEWLAVNAFFAGVYVLFVGAVYVLGWPVKEYFPESGLAWLVAGSGALAIALGATWLAMRLIARQPLKGRGRGRG